jgi:hypothetical protein
MFQNSWAYKDIGPYLNNKATNTVKTEFDSLRCLRGLKIFDSKIGGKDRTPEDNEREGKTPGQELLYTD